MSGAADGYRRYVDALTELGLTPGAGVTADTVRAAYKRRIAECHPDRWPANAEKLAESQRVNAAHDTLEAMIRTGSATQYSQMAERYRRTGGGPPPSGPGPIATPPPPTNLMVIVVAGVAGSGKTHGWARDISRRYARRPGLMIPDVSMRLIYAAPTIDLLDQTNSVLTMNGLAPIILHSKNTKGGVGPALDRFYDKLALSQEALVMISHAALFERPLPPDPERWDLVIDEVPDALQFLAIDAQVTHVHLTNRIEAVPLAGDLYQLVPNEIAVMNPLAWIARVAMNRPFDGGLVHLQELARALLYGRTCLVRRDQWDELLTDWAARGSRPVHGGHLDVLTIVPPAWFQLYRTVTVMGARVMSHLTTLLWQRQFHVEFKPHPTITLPQRHSVAQSRRTTIHYVYEESVTRAFMSRKSESGETMFIATCRTVAAFHMNLRYRTFLWSAPRPGEDKEHGVEDLFWSRLPSSGTVWQVRPFDPALRLPGRTHGLNKEIFLRTRNVALLSVIGFTPPQLEMLHRLGLTDEEIDRALLCDVAYQDALRCALRLAAERHAIHITVLDKRIAEDIATMFQEVRVEKYPDRVIPATRRKSGHRMPSSTDRVRAHRARRAAERHQREEQKRET